MVTNKLQKTIVVGFMVVVGLAPFLGAPFNHANAQQRTVAQAIELSATHLLNSQNTDGSVGDGGASDWAAMAMAAAATNDSRFTNLKTYITAQAGRVDKNSATELERTILATTAVGASPYNVGSRNLVNELKALATGGQIGSPNLLNDDIFAILAFRAAGQDPATEPFKSVIEFVKLNQLGSGGFNDRVGDQQADIDITAVAAVALNPYHNTTAAKNFLVNAQNSDGGFPSRSGSSSNVASTAWTIWAIGLNQRASEYLISQQQPGGSFGSILTTSYSLHALTGRSLPVGFVNAPAQQPVGQPPASQPQQISNAIIQPTPVSVPAAAAFTPSPFDFAQGKTPTSNQKPDVLPVATPGVAELLTPRKQPKKAPATQAQAAQKRVDQPLTTPVASPNQTSNLLLIAGSYPEETLAQTSVEPKTVESSQFSSERIPSSPTVIALLASLTILSVINIFGLLALWRKISSITS